MKNIPKMMQDEELMNYNNAPYHLNKGVNEKVFYVKREH